MAEQQNEIPVQGAEELDDVEGHGLKEAVFVAAVGATAIGGSAYAMTASSGGVGPVQKPAIVQQTETDANQLANDAAQGAGGLAGQTVQDTKTLTGDTVTQATAITAPEVNLATSTAHAAVDLAGKTVTDTTVLAGDEVKAVSDIATATEQAAVKLAGDVTQTAFKTVNSTEQTVLKTANATVATTIQVVKATEDRVGQGWTLDLSVLGMHAQTGGNALAPDGTVTVLDENGVEVASAKVVNGAATVHISAVGQNQSFTIRYSGNPTYSHTSTPWLSPKP